MMKRFACLIIALALSGCDRFEDPDKYAQESERTPLPLGGWTRVALPCVPKQIAIAGAGGGQIASVFFEERILCENGDVYKR